jgi:hypothetical protein
MALFLIANGPMQTNAAFAVVTTGSAIKTMLQVKPGATIIMEITEWGISFDGNAAATPIKVELIEADNPATVTAAAAADITKMDAAALACGDPTTAIFAVGTTSTGYSASGEGTPPTAVRNLDGPQLIAPTNQFIKQFPLGERPTIQVSKYARIRVTAPAAVNAYCYMMLKV